MEGIFTKLYRAKNEPIVHKTNRNAQETNCTVQEANPTVHKRTEPNRATDVVVRFRVFNLFYLVSKIKAMHTL